MPNNATGGLPDYALYFASSLYTLVTDFYMNDLYGINLNYQSITLYLNDNELLSTYHPKYISTHIVYNDSRQSTEGGF